MKVMANAAWQTERNATGTRVDCQASKTRTIDQVICLAKATLAQAVDVRVRSRCDAVSGEKEMNQRNLAGIFEARLLALEPYGRI